MISEVFKPIFNGGITKLSLACLAFLTEQKKLIIINERIRIIVIIEMRLSSRRKKTSRKESAKKHLGITTKASGKWNYTFFPHRRIQMKIDNGHL